MGYLDDYDKRVFKDCKTKAIYKNNIMNNLANGRVISSNTGKGFVVQKPTNKEDTAKTLQKYNLPMKDVFESINVDEFVNEINANGQNFEAIVVYGLGMNPDGDDGNLDDIDDTLNDILSYDFDIPDDIQNPMHNDLDRRASAMVDFIEHNNVRSERLDRRQARRYSESPPPNPFPIQQSRLPQSPQSPQVPTSPYTPSGTAVGAYDPLITGSL